MLAFLYCKSLSRLSLTRDECRALSTGGARAASRYDALKAESAAQHEQRLKRQKAGQKLQGQIMVNMRMLQWRRRAMTREGSGPARKQRAARKHSRRHSTDNAFDPSLVLQLDQPSRMLQQSEEEEDEEEEDDEDLTERFKVTRSGRAMAQSKERRRTLLAGVRSLEKGGAPAAREAALGGLLEECRRDGVWLDPRDVQDAKLQVVERTIGALLEEDAGPNASPRSPPAVDGAAGSVMVSVGAEVQMDEKEIFAEKYLKSGRITIFHTTSTYSHATVLKNCQNAREKMAVARDLGVRAEYDLGLPVNAEVIEALKRYSTQGYTLPQVFFGKDLIDDWDTMSDEMLQSFLDQVRLLRPHSSTLGLRVRVPVPAVPGAESNLDGGAVGRALLRRQLAARSRGARHRAQGSAQGHRVRRQDLQAGRAARLQGGGAGAGALAPPEHRGVLRSCDARLRAPRHHPGALHGIGVRLPAEVRQRCEVPLNDRGARAAAGAAHQVGP